MTVEDDDESNSDDSDDFPLTSSLDTTTPAVSTQDVGQCSSTPDPVVPAAQPRSTVSFAPVNPTVLVEPTSKVETWPDVYVFAATRYDSVAALQLAMMDEGFGYASEVRLFLNLVNYGTPVPELVPQLLHPVDNIPMPQFRALPLTARPAHVWRDEGEHAAEQHIAGFMAERFASLEALIAGLWQWSLGLWGLRFAARACNPGTEPGQPGIYGHGTGSGLNYLTGRAARA